MLRSLATRLAGVSAVGAVLLGSLAAAPAAQAAQTPIDVTSIAVKDVVVSTTSCIKVPVKISLKTASNFVDASGYADVTRNGGLVTMVGIDGKTPETRFQLCPSFDGLGKFTVGPTDFLAEYSYYDESFEDFSSDLVSYTDYTSKTFSVRGKSSVSVTNKRKGSTVTVTVKAKTFVPSKYGTVAYNAKSARLQVKKGSKWVNTGKALSFKKGVAVIKVKQKSKKSYRVVVPASSTAAAVTSKTFKR